jgi:hypothetical protein
MNSKLALFLLAALTVGCGVPTNNGNDGASSQPDASEMNPSDSG